MLNVRRSSVISSRPQGAPATPAASSGRATAGGPSGLLVVVSLGPTEAGAPEHADESTTAARPTAAKSSRPRVVDPRNVRPLVRLVRVELGADRSDERVELADSGVQCFDERSGTSDGDGSPHR